MVGLEHLEASRRADDLDVSKQELAWFDLAIAVIVRQYQRVSSDIERVQAQNKELEEQIEILEGLLRECKEQEIIIASSCQ